MRNIVSVFAVLGLLLCWTAQAWAPTQIATASFSATVPSRVAISLITNASSASSDPAQVIFDTLDIDDTQAPAPKIPGVMYAPLRSSSGNWHVASITANGTGAITLSISATLTGIAQNKLSVFFGGFFVPGDDATPDRGGKSSTWETMPAAKSPSGSGAFIGTVPLNYQLNVANVAAGTYGGSITYTLTQL